MDNRELARMETMLDHYETELDELNKLLVECGFSEGIKTLKETAHELIEENARTGS